MFGNPILFEAFDVRWTLGLCLIVLGTLLMVLAGVLFAILFRHVRGRVRVLSREEAVALALGGDHDRGHQFSVTRSFGHAEGYEVRLSAGIDDLREAAKRGDWLTFWLWPSMMTCWFGGFWALFAGILEHSPVDAIIFVVLSVFMGCVVAIFWFMAWAAIYTSIDAGTAAKRPGAPGP